MLSFFLTSFNFLNAALSKNKKLLKKFNYKNSFKTISTKHETLEIGCCW